MTAAAPATVLVLVAVAASSSFQGLVLTVHRLAGLVERTVGRVNARRGLRQGRQCGRCCCPADHHEHYRPGTDCGRCGARRCPRYRPAPRSPYRALAYPTQLSTGQGR